MASETSTSRFRANILNKEIYQETIHSRIRGGIPVSDDILGLDRIYQEIGTFVDKIGHTGTKREDRSKPLTLARACDL